MKARWSGVLAANFLTLLLVGCSTAEKPKPGVAVGTGPEPLTELDLAHKADAAGDLAGARTHLETALKWAPNLGIAQVDLADVLIRQGDEGPSLEKALTEGERLEPANPRLWRLAGMYAEDQHDAAGAIAAYEKALRFAPDDSKSRFRVAGLYAGANRLPEAMTAYRAVLTQDASDRGARMALADLLERTNSLTAAEQELVTLTQQDPKNALYKQRLDALRVKEGKAAPDANKKAMRPLRKSKY